MGDRASATIEFLVEDEVRVKKLIGSDYYESEVDGDTVIYSAEDLNGGDFNFEKDLRSLKIPYFKTWESGSEFTSGSGKFYIEGTGETHFVENYDDDTGKMYISAIEEAHEKGGWDEIKRLIEIQKTLEAPLDWDGQIKIRETLIKHPAFSVLYDSSFKVELYSNIDQQDFYGDTALLNAIVSKQHDLVKNLLPISNVNICNNDKENALFLALKHSSPFINEIIKSAGVDAQNKDGKTALILSVKNIKTFETLINAGANTLIEDRMGHDVLFYAKDPIIIALIEKSRLEKEIDQDDFNNLSL